MSAEPGGAARELLIPAIERYTQAVESYNAEANAVRHASAIVELMEEVATPENRERLADARRQIALLPDAVSFSVSEGDGRDVSLLGTSARVAVRDRVFWWPYVARFVAESVQLTGVNREAATDIYLAPTGGGFIGSVGLFAPELSRPVDDEVYVSALMQRFRLPSGPPPSHSPDLLYCYASSLPTLACVERGHSRLLTPFATLLDTGWGTVSLLTQGDGEAYHRIAASAGGASITTSAKSPIMILIGRGSPAFISGDTVRIATLSPFGNSDGAPIVRGFWTLTSLDQPGQTP